MARRSAGCCCCPAPRPRRSPAGCWRGGWRGKCSAMRFGITLANRGILLGLATVRDLLALADAIEACPLLDSIWVGDALFVNPRLNALTLLAAIAGRT